MSTPLRFRDYLSADHRDAVGLTATAWDRLEMLLDRREALEILLPHLSELGSPPLPALEAVVDAHRDYHAWRQVAAGSALPPALLTRTRDGHQVAFLEAVATAVAATDLGGALDLWKAALALTRREGEIRARAAVAGDHPDLAAYQDHLTHLSPEELTAHRWLAWRRGEEERLLGIEITLPLDAIRDQAAVHLTPPVARAVTDGILLPSLPAALRHTLDRMAEEEAIRAAAMAYRGLLDTPPLRADRVTALFVGAPRQPLGVAVVDGAGALVDQARFGPHPGWEERVDRWLQRTGAPVFILPTGAPDTSRLAALRRRVPGTAVAIRPAGLAAARHALCSEHPDIPPEVASALLLARRALDPLAAWSALDPVSLGLAEYQQDLAPDRLRARLLDVQARVRHGEGAERAPPAPAMAIPAAALNPLVRSLEDLRPGMVVDAVVTSLAPFGAFVTIGLEEEGLIHVSELSDQFVRDPAEVVRLGQPLRPRVIQVDRERRRVGLSLRQPREKRNRPPTGGRGRALADLEKLFTK